MVENAKNRFTSRRRHRLSEASSSDNRPSAMIGGPGGIEAMIRDMSYQLTRTSPQSLWSVLGIGAAQPLAEAALLLFMLAAIYGYDPSRGLIARRVAAE